MSGRAEQDKDMDTVDQASPPEMVAGPWRELETYHPGWTIAVNLEDMTWCARRRAETLDAGEEPDRVQADSPAALADAMHAADETRRRAKLRVRHHAPESGSPVVDARRADRTRTGWPALRRSRGRHGAAGPGGGSAG